MKKLFTLLALCGGTFLYSQDLVLVSYAHNYAEQAFYRFADDATTNIPNESWDIALTAFGDSDAGIFINESSVVFGSQNVLFLAPTDDFSATIAPADLTMRLLNDEQSWDYGAFNLPRDESNPDDFGWGAYDAATESIKGTKVYAIQFRDGSYKKLQIVSLDQGVYTLKHADLDGANETTLTVDKADFPNNHFIYLPLGSGQPLDIVPSEWDLTFTRYSSPVDDGAGGTFDLVTAGVLSAPGVEVAEASGVVPETVDYLDYEDQFSAVPDIIGYDWKDFDNGNWLIPEDRAYFVKLPTGQIWKVIFIEFKGSSTGEAIFTKEEVRPSAVQEGKSLFNSFAVYPNPMGRQSSVIFSLKKNGRVHLSLSSVFGNIVWEKEYPANRGLNNFALPVMNIPTGTYFMNLSAGGEKVSAKVVKF
ncbi:MAG TPA: T9SS type A sorting domain-containing protein [Bacteroidetes bacterium]|nr:T9SS type A sorting domain-containing protein [Bacteroidota bacterium]